MRNRRETKPFGEARESLKGFVCFAQKWEWKFDERNAVAEMCRNYREILKQKICAARMG